MFKKRKALLPIMEKQQHIKKDYTLIITQLLCRNQYMGGDVYDTF